MAEQWQGAAEKLDEFRDLIPRPYKPAMRTDGLIFADAKMMEQVKKDFAPEQVANVATMPGIVGRSMAMPDIHWGYGRPIGGGPAFAYGHGGVSPGACGDGGTRGAEGGPGARGSLGRGQGLRVARGSGAHRGHRLPPGRGLLEGQRAGYRARGHQRRV